MFVIYGRQTARINKYNDNQKVCQNCNNFDLEIKVYRDYYHLFFIPVFPIGDNTVKIQCKNCGASMRSGSMEKQYESITKTPFYLFTLPILFVCLIIFLVNANLNTQKEKALFVDNPKVGDVYTIRKDDNNKTSYYFLRVVRINGDTVVVYHNNLEYTNYISKLNDDDFFNMDEELYFLKPELKQMLEKMVLNAVDRNYDDYEGFNRIK